MNSLNASTKHSKKMPILKTSTKHLEYFSRFSIVIITGGSSGIGRSIIKAIISLDPDLLLCNLSRSEPKIFLGKNGIHYPVDLCDEKALALTVKAIKKRIRDAPKGEILLVNNSGFGDYGKFSDLESSKQLSMIDLNIRAVVDLTARLLPEMLDKGGTIVNVSSIAAFQPTPFLATYGATKAFVRNWSLALSEDLRGTKVRALVVCPGPTRSNFFKAAGFKDPPMRKGRALSLNMTCDEVAKQTLSAVAQNRTLIVNGWKNNCIAFFCGKMPLLAINRTGAFILRKMRLELHKK